MKTILDTDLVKIKDDGREYKVLIRMSQGGTLEHEPFERNLRGLIAAMQLATECLAGKFYPRRVVETKFPEFTGKQIEQDLVQITADYKKSLGDES